MNSYREALRRAQEIDLHLKATDFLYEDHVIVQHEEGSTFHFRYAFTRVEEIEGYRYLMVFSEHQSFRVFCEEDLHAWWYLRAQESGPNPKPAVDDDEDDENDVCVTCGDQYAIAEKDKHRCTYSIV